MTPNSEGRVGHDACPSADQRILFAQLVMTHLSIYSQKPLAVVHGQQPSFEIFMFVKRIYKPNRKSTYRIFGVFYLQIGVLAVLLHLLKNVLTPYQATIVIGIYAIFSIFILMILVIRNYSTLYFLVVRWSRRFSRPVVDFIILPIFFVIFLSVFPFIYFSFGFVMLAFWRGDQIRGITTLAFSFGFAFYLLVVFYFRAVAWKRGTACGHLVPARRAPRLQPKDPDATRCKIFGFVLTAIMFVPLIIIFAVDIIGTPKTRVEAVVVRKEDAWNKMSPVCNVELKTPFGIAQTSFRDECSRLFWWEGQHVSIDVRIGRLSQRIVVMHNSADLADGRPPPRTMTFDHYDSARCRTLMISGC